MKLLSEQEAICDPAPLEAEILIEEARRRQRRRWTVGVVVVVIALAGTIVGVALAVRAGISRQPAPPATINRTLSAPALGAIVKPDQPTALAVGPNDNLYLADVGRDQILERFSNGTFRVVAGTSKRGFSGDGGLAVDAQLRLVANDDGGSGSGLAFGAHGRLYVADYGNDRVRVITPNGRIHTVLGNGRQPRPERLSRTAAIPDFRPTPALSFALGAPSGLDVAPGGALYVSAADLVKLSPDGIVSWVAGGRSLVSAGNSVATFCTAGITSCFPPAEFELNHSGALARDGRGDLFIMNGNATFGVAEVKTNGKIVTYGRGFGFGLAQAGSLAYDPNGSVIVASLYWLWRINEMGKVSRIPAALGPELGPSPIDGRPTPWYVSTGVAIGPDGTIYVDSEPYEQQSFAASLLKVSRAGHVMRLWIRRV